MSSSALLQTLRIIASIFWRIFVRHTALWFVTGCIVLAGLSASTRLTPVSAQSATAPLIAFDLSPLDQKQPYFTFSVKPGQTIESAALVRNGGSQPVTLNLRSADPLTPPNGGIVWSQAGQSLHAEGAWLTVSQPRMTVAPRRSNIVLFTLHVPASAAPGQHIAALILDNTVTEKVGPHTSYIGSVAMAVVITVQGHASAGMHITGLTVTETKGQVIFHLGLTNTGHRWVYPRGTITITGGTKHHTASIPIAINLLLGGASVQYTLSVPGHLASGRYIVSANLNDATTGVTATLKPTSVYVRDSGSSVTTHH